MHDRRVALAVREVRPDVAEHTVSARAAGYRNAIAVALRKLYVAPPTVEFEPRIGEPLLGGCQRLANSVDDGRIVAGNAPGRIHRIFGVERDRIQTVNGACGLPEFRPDLHATAVDIRRPVPFAQGVTALCKLGISVTNFQDVVQQELCTEVPVAENDRLDVIGFQLVVCAQAFIQEA